MRDCCDSETNLNVRSIEVVSIRFGKIEINLERSCKSCGDRGTIPVISDLKGHIHLCISCAGKVWDTFNA